ncbi:MAG: GNAT family N-acetyltransferase [Sphingomonas sp.]
MATVEQQVRIDAGSSEDIDSVMTIMGQAFGRRYGEAWTRSQLGGILPMGGVSLTLARDTDDGATIGFSLFRTVAGESELLLIAVVPDRHRCGIGGMLLYDFIDRARTDGVKRVHLEVRDGNSAVGLYRKAGFSPVGRRRNYYHAPDGRRFDAVTLAYEL